MPDTKPHYHGHRDRLRKRFEKLDLDALADYEAVELLLTLAIPRGDTKPLAKDLLARFQNLRGILDAPRSELKKVPGIGDVTPTALQFIKAVATLYLQQEGETRDSFTNREHLHNTWRMRLGALKHEVFEVAYLDSGGTLLRDGIEQLATGTMDRAAVYPRNIIAAALKRDAAIIVLAHNHPNGNVTPTEHDKIVTRAIVLAADTIQMRVLDHLIVSADEVFSFRKEGLL